MDSLAKEYWEAKLRQHRDNRARILDERLQELNVQGVLRSSHAPVTMYAKATEYLGTLIANWAAMQQDSWIRLNPTSPESVAAEDATEARSMIDEEERRVVEEITAISERFQWDQRHLDQGKERLRQSCAVQLTKCLAQIAMLKERRIQELQEDAKRERREWRNRKIDVIQALGIAVVAVLLTDYFGSKQVKVYQEMVTGLTLELRDLKNEYRALARSSIRSEEEIDREIERVNQDSARRAKEIKAQHAQKRSQFRSDMARRGTSNSSTHEFGLKRIDTEEVEALKAVEIERIRKIEDLRAEKKRLPKS